MSKSVLLYRFTLAAMGCLFGCAATCYALSIYRFRSDALVGILLAATLLGGACLYRWAVPACLRRSAAQTGSGRACWLIACLLGGVLLAAAIPLPPSAPLWQPRQMLEVMALGTRNAASQGSDVWLLTLARAAGNPIPVSTCSASGAWDARDGGLVSGREQPATLRWRGRIPGDLHLRLATGPQAGEVRLTWNGQVQTVDLYRPESGVEELALRASPRVVWLAGCQVGMAWLGASLALGLVLLALTVAPARAAVPQRPVRWPSMLGYALPCVVCWSLTLVAFWPGLMSPDSVGQWYQIERSIFTDGHPAFHGMCLWLIMRIWHSPGAVALAQILTLSLAVGMGLRTLRALGVPWAVVGVAAGVFALSPINNTYVNTIWKDIPFGAVLLVLTTLLLRTVASDGKALQRWTHVVGLAASGAALCLFRHNGLPTVGIALVCLGLAFPRQWWRVAATCGVCALLIWAVRGPLFRRVGVAPAELAVVPEVHAIAAHVAHGTPLSPEDKLFLDQVMPSGQWIYDPYNSNPLVHGALDYDALRTHRRELLRVLWDCTRRAPLVTLAHLRDVSSLVWRVRYVPGSWYSTTLGTPYDGKVLTIVENESGLAPDPILPSWREACSKLVVASQADGVFWLFWRPAFWTYLALFAALATAARHRQWRYILVVIPILANSALIAFIAPAQDLRYQYPVILVAMQLWPLAFCRISGPPTASER